MRRATFSLYAPNDIKLLKRFSLLSWWSLFTIEYKKAHPHSSLSLGMEWAYSCPDSIGNFKVKFLPEAVDMNGRFQMQGGKNWILPKYINATRFLWDSHWLEIWSNHFCPSMGLNGGSVATDSVNPVSHTRSCIFLLTSKESDKHSYLQYVIIMVIGQAI
jgi:hypothetical protein